MTFLFWLSTLIGLYTYMLYPLGINYLAKEKSKKQSSNELNFTDLPDISVVLAVYNGESFLKKRLDNIFDSNYPSEKITVIVSSDGSTDKTVEIAEKYEKGHVLVIDSKENMGKSTAVNKALIKAKTDLVAFCDIRQTFSSNALYEMTKALLDENVGAVTGNLMIANDENNIESDPGLYWKYEKWIRDNESQIKSLVGVTGAIYMAKRELMPIMRRNTILDDMFIPLSIVKKGFNIKMVNDAIAYDVSSSSINEEFNRKVRTLAGNFQLMKLLPWINTLENPLLFQWLSHKVGRLLVPYAMISLFISSAVLEGFFYQFIFWSQCVFYLYGGINYIAIRNNNKLPLGNIIVNFLTLNYAALLAGWKYYFSSTKNLWKKH